MQLGRTVDRPRCLVVHELDEGWVGDGGGCGVGISAIGGWRYPRPVSSSAVFTFSFVWLIIESCSYRY
jgi:hypothetical protein